MKEERDKLNRMLTKVLTVGMCSWLLGCGLGADVTIEAFNLRVTPSPAQEGDLVSLVFEMTVIAEGSVTLSALIDGEVYSTQTAPRLFSGVFTWEIGDAGALIDTFDLGDHTAQIRIRDPGSDRTVATSPVTFTLVAAAP
jgi:hypothetical protein